MPYDTGISRSSTDTDTELEHANLSCPSCDNSAFFVVGYQKLACHACGFDLHVGVRS